MKVTADTITDEQIKQLRDLPVYDATDFGRRNLADYALAGKYKHLRSRARARCAEIWNARHGGEP